MSSTTPDATENQELPRTDSQTQWESIGRELLQARLEHVGETVLRDPFRHAAGRIGDGEHLRKQDVQSMRDALLEAEQLLTLVARAAPETTPSPDPWEFLDETAKQQYIAESTERRE
jgi:hypothetical protein